MRTGSLELLMNSLLIKLLRSNFRFRSKISCPFNTKLCHLIFRILDTKCSKCPLSPTFLYNADNQLIPAYPLEYVNALCNKRPVSRCICTQTKPNKTNKPSNYPPNGTCSASYLQKEDDSKVLLSPFQKHFD
jgi:hypothetical protein